MSRMERQPMQKIPETHTGFACSCQERVGSCFSCRDRHQTRVCGTVGQPQCFLVVFRRSGHQSTSTTSPLPVQTQAHFILSGNRSVQDHFEQIMFARSEVLFANQGRSHGPTHFGPQGKSALFLCRELRERVMVRLTDSRRSARLSVELVSVRPWAPLHHRCAASRSTCLFLRHGFMVLVRRTSRVVFRAAVQTPRPGPRQTWPGVCTLLLLYTPRIIIFLRNPCVEVGLNSF